MGAQHLERHADLNPARAAVSRKLRSVALGLDRSSGASGLGAESYGGPVVTAGGLVFIAATPDAKLRAFDKRTGELRFEADLPAGGFATPALYEANGRAFVVVAAGGAKLGTAAGSEYVAFALPAAGGAGGLD